MEEFFEKSILERLYDSLNMDFRSNILSIESNYKNYYTMVNAERKLLTSLKDIIGNDPKKVNKIMSIIKEIQFYYNQESEFWNKNYFKLGFTYMVDLCNPNDFSRLEREQYSNKVHDFLDNIKNKKLDYEPKVLLIDFIKNLQNGTDKQKRRFLLYYNLTLDDSKSLNYSEIAKIEGCSSSAIKISVINIISQLVRLEGSQKITFLAIMKKINT